MNRKEADYQENTNKEALKSKGNVFIGTFALLVIITILLIMTFIILLYMSFANS